MAEQGTVVQFRKQESMEEPSEAECEQFSFLAEALDEAEADEESRVRLEPALVNGKRRVVVWVDDGDEDDDGDQPCVPVAVLLTDADTIQAEGVEYVEPAEAHTVH
jgi:hypothetical protein